MRVLPSSSTKHRACSSSWTYLAGGGVPVLLVRVLLRDDNVNVCLAALDGLADLDDDTLIDPLMALLEKSGEAPATSE